MKYFINQFQGIGDILFCEPIARHYYNNGENEIYWVILDEFLWLKEYIEYINFIPKSQSNFNFENSKMGFNGEFFLLPLRFANPLYRNLQLHDYSDQYHCMLDKYRLLGLNINLWKTLKLKRNLEKENNLIKELNIKNEYNLINNNWSDGILNIEENNGLENIYMRYIKGYTLVDWLSVIENSTNIYTASTSIVYLLETCKFKNINEIIIYPRMPREYNLDGIKEFINPKFKLIEYDK